MFFSWADVIGYDAFLEEIKDPQQRADMRARTIALFNLLDRSAMNFRRQRDVLNDIPAKAKEEALQIYFW